MISIDFSTAPVGAPPPEIRVIRGKLEVVEKDGTRMLKSSEESAFLVAIREKIPNRFALEFDFVPKFSGYTNTTELSFEGTREVSHSDESAHVMWSHNRVSVIGGGQAYAGGQVDIPEDLKEEVIGNLTQIRAEFDGPNLSVKTNGRTVFESQTAQFNRGRILRVQLGGTDDDENAVYLAGMRMVSLDGGSAGTATSSQALGGLAPPRGQTSGGTQEGSGGSVSATSLTVTGIKATLDASGVAIVTWDPLPVSATYTVMRWNISDPYCCNNMVPPDAALTGTAWQDIGIPRSGTYGYRVIGQTSEGLVYGETQVNFTVGTTPTGTVAGTTNTPPPAPQAPETLFAPSPTPVPLTSTPETTTTTASGLPRTGGTIVQPDTTTATTTTTATGTPTSGTIVQPDGSTAPYSSGRRTVSVMTSEPASSTLGTVEPIPEPSVGVTPTVGTVVTGTTAEPVTAVLATAPTQTGTVAPIADPTIMQPASQVSGGPGMPTPTTGRFRVTITGFATAKLTADDPLNLDGKGDEVYAAAVVVNWNRTTRQLTSFTTVETLVHGDTGSMVPLPNRVRAGSGSMTGGIIAGDRVPSSYDPTGAAIPQPTPDRLPLLVWEGELTAGVEEIVICPSLWEHDGSRAQFGSYKANWTRMSASVLINSPEIAGKLSPTSIQSFVVPLSGAVRLAPPAPTFAGSVTEGYKIAGLTFGPGIDRPIGLGLVAPGVVSYQDHFLLLTQESVASLASGSGTTLAIPYVEPLDPFLLGLYTLYVRVERTQ